MINRCNVKMSWLRFLISFSLGWVSFFPWFGSAYGSQKDMRRVNLMKDSQQGQNESKVLGVARWLTQPKLWQESLRHSNLFFIEHAWDQESGSFASEIDVDGSRISTTRHLIASSRVLYGLANSLRLTSGRRQMAQRQAEFILTQMTRTDGQGPYFLSAVDDKGKDLDEQPTLVVNEQAYGLNGLVALYAKTKSPELLAKIEEYYLSFYRRFHDDQDLGFFDGFDRDRGRPVPTKSYNSTVYVATAFLVELASLNTPKQGSYVRTLQELLDLVASHFLDPQGTGWIIENFTADWKPDWRDWQRQVIKVEDSERPGREPLNKEVSIGIAGHNYQAAWLLMRGATEFNRWIDVGRRNQYLSVARQILTSMLQSNSLDRENGGVFDAFIRETDHPMWNENKAWWQQAEAMLALAKATSIGLFEGDGWVNSDAPGSNAPMAFFATEQLEKIARFYFDHFIDRNQGGEFFTVTREGVPVPGEPKGQKGKASYHATELARYMLEYLAHSP